MSERDFEIDRICPEHFTKNWFISMFSDFTDRKGNLIIVEDKPSRSRSQESMSTEHDDEYSINYHAKAEGPHVFTQLDAWRTEGKNDYPPVTPKPCFSSLEHGFETMVVRLREIGHEKKVKARIGVAIDLDTQNITQYEKIGPVYGAGIVHPILMHQHLILIYVQPSCCGDPTIATAYICHQDFTLKTEDAKSIYDLLLHLHGIDFSPMHALTFAHILQTEDAEGTMFCRDEAILEAFSNALLTAPYGAPIIFDRMLERCRHEMDGPPQLSEPTSESLEVAWGSSRVITPHRNDSIHKSTGRKSSRSGSESGASPSPKRSSGSLKIETDINSSHGSTISPRKTPTGRSPLTKSQIEYCTKRIHENSKKKIIRPIDRQCLVTYGDMERLDDKGWLNDVIINDYFSLIKKSYPDSIYCFKSHFYQSLENKVQTRSKKTSHVPPDTDEDFTKYSLLLIPINVSSSHWCLLVVNLKGETMEYYDSLGGKAKRDIFDKFQIYMEENKSNFSKTKGAKFAFARIDKEKKIPQQSNGYDCGVFVCIYALYLARNAPLNFSGRDVKNFRQMMKYELLTGKLL